MTPLLSLAPQTKAVAFTAAQIAVASRISKRAVLKSIAGIPAAEIVFVRGNQTPAWTFDTLTEKLRAEITRTADEYRQSVADYLDSVCKPWEPKMPLAQIADSSLALAHKLRDALLPALQRMDSPMLEPADHIRLGLADYHRVFGHIITARHWRRLRDRTLRRAGVIVKELIYEFDCTACLKASVIKISDEANPPLECPHCGKASLVKKDSAFNSIQTDGTEDFERLEIYLPEKPACKADAKHLLPAEMKFKSLTDEIQGFADPAAPTRTEIAGFWAEAFELYQAGADTRREQRALRRALVNLLFRHAPWLAQSKHAVRLAFDRKYARWIENGESCAALLDGRELKRGKPTAEPYDPEQVALIKYTAAHITGGRRAEAVRELNEKGLITDPRLQKSLNNAARKSYLPAALRAELKDVPAWRVVAQGARATRKMVPSSKLNYDGIFSMTCLVGDDHTPDLYVAVPDGTGWFDVMRPQLIVVNDFRSSRILSRAIVPHPQYTGLDVVAAYKRAFKKYGLPKFILREGGIWRRSNLVNSLADIGTGRPSYVGKQNGSFSPIEIKMGLEQRGIRICDTPDQVARRLGEVGIEFRESYQPRSKPVEGIIRLLSNIVERLPCYCGRNERLDCPESTVKSVALVRARKARPEDVGMMVWHEWVDTVDSLIEKYNSTRQEGRRLTNPWTGAPLSPDEAFELFTNKNDPPSGYDAHCEMFLSSMRVEVEVKKPNLRRRNFPCGFVELMGNTYCDEQTGARIGKTLLAFYDPETPEICAFTEKSIRDPFVVPRLESTNALFPDERTSVTRSQAQRTISAVRADYKAAESKFAPIVRRTLIDPLTKEFNARLVRETERVLKVKKERNRARENIRKFSGSVADLLESTERGISTPRQLRPGQVENAPRLAEILQDDEPARMEDSK